MQAMGFAARSVLVFFFVWLARPLRNPPASRDRVSHGGSALSDSLKQNACDQVLFDDLHVLLPTRSSFMSMLWYCDKPLTDQMRPVMHYAYICSSIFQRMDFAKLVRMAP